MPLSIVSLDVVAGNDVAFAYALLRCGTPAEVFLLPPLSLSDGDDPVRHGARTAGPLRG